MWTPTPHSDPQLRLLRLQDVKKIHRARGQPKYSEGSRRFGCICPRFAGEVFGGRFCFGGEAGPLFLIHSYHSGSWPKT